MTPLTSASRWMALSGVLAVTALLVLSVASVALASASGRASPSAGLRPALTCPGSGNGTVLESNVTTGPAPLAVAFCASYNDSSAIFSWFFGDGGNASGPSVNHTFVTPGAYDVRLSILGPGVNVTEFKWIYATGGAPGTIGVNVTADQSAGGPPYPLSVTVALSSCAGYCWINWTYANATFVSTPQPINQQSTYYQFTADVPATGTWTISVTAGDPIGDAGNGSTVVSVSGYSGFQIQSVGANEVNGPAPLTTTFFVNYTGAVGNVTAIWAFGDGGNGSGLQVTHTYTAVGSYVATVWLNDTRTATSGSVGINVTNGTGNGSGLLFALSPVTWYGVAPFTVQLEGEIEGGSAPYVFLVDWGNGQPTLNFSENSAGTFSLNYTYGAPGNYTITATVWDHEGDSLVLTDPIGVANAASLSAVGQSAFTVGPGDVAAAAVCDVSGGSAPYTLQYVWGDGSVSSAPNDGLAVHLYSTPGLYHPFVNVTDATGATLEVGLGTVNVTAVNGTVPAGAGNGLLPSTSGGWGMVELAAAVGVGVGLVTTAGIAYESRRRSVRKQGEGIANALESEAATGGRDPPSGDVKRE